MTACAGTPVNWDNARQIKTGMTQKEITELMGRPYLVKAQAGGQLWVWSYVNGITGSVRTLSVPFDSTGRVSEVPPVPDSF